MYSYPISNHVQKLMSMCIFFPNVSFNLEGLIILLIFPPIFLVNKHGWESVVRYSIYFTDLCNNVWNSPILLAHQELST